MEKISFLIKKQKKKVGYWSKNKPSSSTTNNNTSNKTSFQNCTELRKFYPDGVSKSHPVYQAKMDPDKDGYACER